MDLFLGIQCEVMRLCKSDGVPTSCLKASKMKEKFMIFLQSSLNN